MPPHNAHHVTPIDIEIKVSHRVATDDSRSIVHLRIDLALAKIKKISELSDACLFLFLRPNLNGETTADPP